VAALGCTLAGMGALSAAPISGEVEEPIEDRAVFIPIHRYPALQGKMIGLLVGNALHDLDAQEGGSGSTDAMLFSTGGSCYRWVYVPVTDHPGINQLDIAVGEKGREKKRFVNLDLACPRTVKQWDVPAPYALVEIEVNDNLGAPPTTVNQGFVATRMKRLDGTKDFPLKVADVVEALRKRYTTYLEDRKGVIDKAVADARQAALKGKKPNSPRRQEDTMYLTWLPEKQRMRVHFRTVLTEGALRIAGSNINLETGARGSPVGISYGIEFGMGYEVSKEGRVVRRLPLPIASFKKELRPPDDW
jgi:hypothetical protein